MQTLPGRALCGKLLLFAALALAACATPSEPGPALVPAGEIPSGDYEVAAIVSSAGRRCGSPARLNAIVNTIDEIVMRMLAFVSAIRLSCT